MYQSKTNQYLQTNQPVSIPLLINFSFRSVTYQ